MDSRSVTRWHASVSRSTAASTPANAVKGARAVIGVAVVRAVRAGRAEAEGSTPTGTSARLIASDVVCPRRCVRHDRRPRAVTDYFCERPAMIARRHRRLRRLDPHRQARRRRLARGQADAAAGAGRRPCRCRATTHPGSRVGASRLDDAGVAAVQDVIVATGALAALEARIADLAAEAVAALHGVDITPEARCRLVELAAFVVARVL